MNPTTPPLLLLSPTMQGTNLSRICPRFPTPRTLTSLIPHHHARARILPPMTHLGNNLRVPLRLTGTNHLIQFYPRHPHHLSLPTLPLNLLLSRHSPATTIKMTPKMKAMTLAICPY